MYARYKSHHAATSSDMEDALRRFQTFKAVLLLGQPGEKARPDPMP